MADTATNTNTNSPPTKISPLRTLSPSHISQTVVLHGWSYAVREQGAGTLVFIDLGDGSTVLPIRCVASNEIYGTSSSSSLTHTVGDVTDPPLTFEQLKDSSKLCTGCSLQIIGQIVSPPEGTTQTFEVQILSLLVIGDVQDASKYPIQKSIMKKPAALRSLPHARFRAPLIQAMMRIRSEALFAVHEFFQKEGVPLLDPNIMTSNDCEGAGEVFKVTPQFFTPVVEEPKKSKKDRKKDKKKKKEKPPPATVEDGTTTESKTKEDEGAPPTAAVAELQITEDTTTPPTPPPTTEKSEPNLEVGLTVSSQLPLEAMSMGTGAVYTCQKSFRAEKSDTNKHLAEFLHVEYEQYFLTLDELIDQAERYVKHVITTVLDRCEAQYDFMDNKAYAPPELKGHRDYLRSFLDQPFVRITHEEAVQACIDDSRDKNQTWVNPQGKTVRLKFKQQPKIGEDLSGEMERYLVQKYGTFTFVTHWPSKIKSFYMKQVGDGTCESFDLLAPLVGELFGGSMREWRYDVLKGIMEEKKMDMGVLGWYLDLRKDGTAPHGGWGMGFDRLVMFLCNAASVRDVVPYPVYYGHCPY